MITAWSLERFLDGPASPITLDCDRRHRFRVRWSQRWRRKGAIMISATAKTRIEFSKILFATDFSPAAARAIPYVKMIAKHYDARVVALHVAAPMVNPMTQPAAWPAVLEAENARRQERQKELRAEFAGIPANSMVEEGDILFNVHS